MPGREDLAARLPARASHWAPFLAASFALHLALSHGLRGVWTWPSAPPDPEPIRVELLKLPPEQPAPGPVVVPAPPRRPVPKPQAASPPPPVPAAPARPLEVVPEPLSPAAPAAAPSLAPLQPEPVISQESTPVLSTGNQGLPAPAPAADPVAVPPRPAADLAAEVIAPEPPRELPVEVPVPLHCLTRLPVPLAPLAPVYPEGERAFGREAHVVTEVLIDPTGAVTAVRIVKTAGASFDEAVRAALLAARFKPALVGDTPVAVKLRVPFRFRLD